MTVERAMRRAIAVSLAGALWAAGPAHAQQGAQQHDDLRRVISDLEQRIGQLESARGALPASPSQGEPGQRREPAGWENGFFLRSGDGSTSLRIRGQVQVDGRYMADDPDDARSADSFALRRVRPSFEGTLYEGLDFRILPELANSRLEILDAYVNARASSALQLRVGKAKSPFGIERLQSSTALRFNERALSDNLVPNRDIGVMVHGELLEQQIAYSFGAFNGVDDGASGEGDSRDAKDLLGRIFVQPFRASGIAPLAGLGLGIAASSGKQSGSAALPGFRSSGSRDTFFRYIDDGAGALADTRADGRRTRISPQASWYWGPLGVQGEYVRSSQELSRGADSAQLAHRAWQVQLAWVLTGEAASYRGISPKRPFSPGKGGLGAIEWVARFSRLNVDNDAFPLFADPAASARRAAAWAVGLNWYWNPNVNWMISYEQTTFENGGGAADLERERAVLTRLQLQF
jgi:phosphate-selective porin OprO/OprP